LAASAFDTAESRATLDRVACWNSNSGRTMNLFSIMAKTRISSTDLTALFVERMKRFSECPAGILIAIVPSDAKESGWSVVMNAGQRRHHQPCVRRIQMIEKQLRRIYVLAKD
jgi:hypothetical protein